MLPPLAQSRSRRRPVISSGGGGEPTPDLLWLRFNDGSGSTAADGSGNGNHLALNSTPAWVAGQGGGAILFDSLNGQVSGPLATFPAWTVSFWLKTTQGDTGVVCSIKGPSGQTEIFLYINSGQLFCRTFDGSTFNTVNTAGTYNDGNWHHFAVVGAGTAGKIYVDGGLEVTGTISLATYGGDAIYFGSFPGFGFWFLAGPLDDYRIYSTPLTALEVAAVYAAPI